MSSLTLTLPTTLDTNRLQAALESLLPDAAFYEHVIQDSDVAAALREFNEKARATLTDLASIQALIPADTIENLLEPLQEASTELLETLEQLPDKLMDNLEEQFETQAKQTLATIEEQILEPWVTLSENWLDQLLEQLLQQLLQLANLLENSIEHLRTQTQTALTNSQQHLQEQIQQALEASAERLKAVILDLILTELLSSQLILTIGSQTTAALSPLLPTIKAARELAEEINRLIELADW